jgi:hypothetical protein
MVQQQVSSNGIRISKDARHTAWANVTRQAPTDSKLGATADVSRTHVDGKDGEEWASLL